MSVLRLLNIHCFVRHRLDLLVRCLIESRQEALTEAKRSEQIKRLTKCNYRSQLSSVWKL